MQKFEYYSPTRIVFGKDTEKRAGELAGSFGAQRVFVIYGGQSAIKSGLIDRVRKSILEAGLKETEMGGVVPNPLLSKVHEMIRAAIDFRADFILAVGGGSVIDTAKAVAHGVANPDRDVWDFWCGKAKLEKTLPIAAILTISAAGSETSDSTVITNDETEPHTKRGLSTDLNRCKFAIMNPVLTMTLPSWQIGAGVADIFMHTSERYFTDVQGNHLTDEIAEGLFRNIIAYGPRGLRNPEDYEAMSEIMWSGSVSHVGLTGIGAKADTPREGDWACHQLGMALSAIYDSTHGATLTAVWGSWAEYVCGENISRFAQFGRNVYGIKGKNEEETAKEAIDKTKDFFRSLGMPLTLTELLKHEPSDEEIERAAIECSYGKTRKIGSFKTLDLGDMIKIYQMAR